MSDNENLNAALAAATCALLGVAAPALASETERWSFDTSLLYYAEDEDRVQDISAVIAAKRDFDAGRLPRFAGLRRDRVRGRGAGRHPRRRPAARRAHRQSGDH